MYKFLATCFLLFSLAFVAYKYQGSIPSNLFTLSSSKEDWVFQAKYSHDKVHAFRSLSRFKAAPKDIQVESKHYPFLMLELKIWQEGEVKRGFVVWDMLQGEMMQDVHFESFSEGFKDCLLAKANSQELELLRLLNQKQGLSFEKIKQLAFFSQKDDKIKQVLNSGISKGLFLERDEQYFPFFKAMNLDSVVFFKDQKALEVKEGKITNKIAERFSVKELQDATHAYFGPAYSVVDSNKVFLPVFCFKAKSQDKIERIQYWNAVTGNLVQYPKVL